MSLLIDDMTRTVYVAKFCFAFCYLDWYILCIWLHEHSTVDAFPEIAVLLITETEILTGNKTHLRSHTLYNCIVVEDLIFRGSWKGHHIFYPAQTFLFKCIV
jgi:hypothetical protein